MAKTAARNINLKAAMGIKSCRRTDPSFGGRGDAEAQRAQRAQTFGHQEMEKPFHPLGEQFFELWWFLISAWSAYGGLFALASYKVFSKPHLNNKFIWFGLLRTPSICVSAAARCCASPFRPCTHEFTMF